MTIKGKPYHPDWEQMQGGEQEQLARLKAVPVNCQLEQFFCFAPREDKLQEVAAEEVKTVLFFFEWPDKNLLVSRAAGNSRFAYSG